MTKEYYTRMGDGSRISQTREQIYEDLTAGTAIAADLANVPVLSSDEIDKMAEIIMDPSIFVSVERGREVALSMDGGTIRIDADQGNSGCGIPASRLIGLMTHERVFCQDTIELGHIDYSFKPVKPIISHECQNMEVIQQNTIVPVFYGAMPNMGLYYTPDGPYANPSDLMREFKIAEAMESIEHSIEHLTRDMVWIMQKLMASGSDGVNFDTTGAAGDGDFLATLLACEKLRSEFPDMYIEIGMAGESVLGMHGSVEYDGTTLAGLWPHEQAKLCAKAGSNLYGPAINTNTGKSFTWNLARAVTFTKAAVIESPIPVHVNMGMGVGGVPMLETPPVDAVTRANKAMVEIAGVDGI